MTTAALTAAPANADDLPRFITPAQFAERFQISRSLTYELMAAGKLRTVKINSARRIPVEAVRDYAESLTGGEIGGGNGL